MHVRSASLTSIHNQIRMKYDELERLQQGEKSESCVEAEKEQLRREILEYKQKYREALINQHSERDRLTSSESTLSNVTSSTSASL